MTDFFKLDGLTLEQEPAITKWGFEDLGDDPDQHRWRAWWVGGIGECEVCGIGLRAYPVIKVNPQSVWIDEWADRAATKQPWEEGAPGMEWVAYEGKAAKKRLLHNGSGSAWAKPTQEEALESLAIRLCRWSNHVNRDVRKALQAAEVMSKLRPQHLAYTEYARNTVQASLKG